MKTQMSRFQIHDDLTAPEGSLPVLRGASAARWPAPELPRRARRLARGAARLRALPLRAAPRHPRAADPRAHRARGRRSTTTPSPGLPLHARIGAHCRPRHRRGRPRPRVGLRATPREAGAAALPQARSSSERGRGADAPPRGGARGGLDATSSCSRRSPSWRSSRSPRWSTSRARSRSTARSRRRGSSARRSHSAMAPRTKVATSPSTTGAPTVTCCPHLHEAVELVGKRWTGRDPLRAAQRRAAALLRDRQAVPQLSDRLLLRADEGARGARHRRAPRATRTRPCASSTQLTAMGQELAPALDELQRVGAALAGLTGLACTPGPGRPAGRPTRLRDADGRSPQTRRRRQGARRGARHPLHPAVVHRHPRPAEVLLDQRATSSTTPSRAAWASTAPRSPASTRSRSPT